MLRAMSVLARPFSPEFARKAAAAVVMNRDTFTFKNDVRVRFPSLLNTALADLLGARGSTTRS